MKVYLVRHAIAHERDRTRWPDDSKRPLTPGGKRRFRKAARGLVKLLPGPITILTSPFVRARQTAAILSAVSGGKIVECRELAHGGTSRAVFELLKVRAEKCVVLVGHEPEFGRLLAAMLGAGTARLRLKKGGAAFVEFPERVGPGSALLAWLLPPRILRRVR
jgi:phosphohistidine phosphatase